MGIKKFGRFEECDRHDFPDGIVSVTEEQFGGEATLILLGEKTVLHDCGMAYAADDTISSLRDKLNGRPLDYILVSHSHYDHIGAMPYIKKAFPEVKVCGSEYAKYVFSRSGALDMMEELGRAAAQHYGTGNEEITARGMDVDIVLKDGDDLDIGNGHFIRALETKGHTDCAMTYVVEPEKIMFTSESTGICVGPEKTEVAILKSFEDSMESLEKCRSYGAKRIISPHFGIVPESYNEEYWNVFEKMAWNEREYVVGMWNSGMTPQEMLDKASKEVFDSNRSSEQPYEAFIANAKVIIKLYEQYADKHNTEG